MSKLIYSPTDEARKFTFVREAGQNHGLMVEAIQHWSGGQPGDSWCAFFVLFIFDVCFGGKTLNPLARSGAVQVIYAQAKRNKWITDNPQKDDLYIYVNDADHAHHVGIYTGNNQGIAGNTSEDGTSSNGDRVAEHSLITNPNRIKYIHYT